MKIKVEHLEKSFLHQAILKDVSFQVETGKFVSILGVSGCGKSTLLNILAGRIKGDGGKIYIDQKEVCGMSNQISYMTQEDLLLPWMNIIDNVCLYGKIHNSYQSMKEKALQLSKEFGLDQYEYAYPEELSGGMRQRAAFLRTVLCGNEILLLDEPFAALDVMNRQFLQDWLLEMKNKYQFTIICVTHDIEEAIYLSDEVYILDKYTHQLSMPIQIQTKHRNRSWLFEQTKLKMDIYHLLKEQENVL